ncbi:HIT family protein [Methanoregula sp.]|uniref:HIT family protein n=1 Tax=Methanoregula sp. TaxID=2052170 RepID=UPI00356911EA
MEETFRSDGYNIGFAVGEASGQTVMHCHCHVIPRYAGGVENPRGSVRGVVPGRGH